MHSSAFGTLITGFALCPAERANLSASSRFALLARRMAHCLREHFTTSFYNFEENTCLVNLGAVSID